MSKHSNRLNRYCSGLACAGVLLFSFIGVGRAEESKIDAVLKQLEQTHSFEGVSISPDGKWVTWSQAAQDNAQNTEIYRLDWKHSDAKPERVSAGDGNKSYRETGLAWSSDSAQIAFLSNAGPEDQNQVYVMPTAGGRPHRVTDLKGYV